MVFLLAVMVYSTFWGRVTRFSVASKRMTALASFIMRYSRSGLDPIRAYLAWSIYLLTGLAGSGVLLAAFRLDLLGYSALEPRYAVFIPVGIIAQVSLSSLILMLIASLNTKADWFSVVLNIPWVRISALLPRYLSLLYPLSGAFVEELFFRGTVFLILLIYFPQAGIVVPVLVSSVLFVIQQVLNTDSLTQGLLISIGSVTISVVGCLLILLTGSLLPALLCHELYAVFYVRLRQQPAGYKLPGATSFGSAPGAGF